jgi:hypothetical protein
VLRVVLLWIDLDGLLNTAIEQIRAYATTDAAVSLRLLRLLQDVAVTVEGAALRQRIVERGRRVVEGCRGQLPPDDFARLEQRQSVLEGIGSNAGAAELARRHHAASVDHIQVHDRPANPALDIRSRSDGRVITSDK